MTDRLLAVVQAGVRQVDLGGGESATVDVDLLPGRPERARS